MNRIECSWIDAATGEATYAGAVESNGNPYPTSILFPPRRGFIPYLHVYPAPPVAELSRGPGDIILSLQLSEDDRGYDCATLSRDDLADLQAAERAPS